MKKPGGLLLHSEQEHIPGEVEPATTDYRTPESFLESNKNGVAVVVVRHHDDKEKCYEYWNNAKIKPPVVGHLQIQTHT